ncbi:MAG: hypothetical protein ACO3A2_11000, partial [Bdellovibrionia bacterium]
MRRTLLRLFCILVFGITLSPTLAFSDFKVQLAQVYALFKNGAYVQAYEDLMKLPSDSLSHEEKSVLAYWKGICLCRMQEFEKGAFELKAAQRTGARFKDLDYELGQALYATQQLRAALEAFERSIVKKYKLGASMYYKGFIHQILEDDAVAISTYRAILNLPDDEDKVKEGSLLQMAELELNRAMAESDLSRRKTRVKKRVVPAFQAVIDFNSFGVAADEARKSLLSLEAQFALNEPPKFANGSWMPVKAWNFRVAQDLKYDSNVVIQANNSILSVANTGSPFTRTEFDLRYDWVWKKKWVFSPEVLVFYIFNSNRNERLVYQNDTLSASAYLRGRLEHFIFSRPAATSFEFEYNHTLRDYRPSYTLEYFNRYYNLVFGNRIQFLKQGSTTLNLNLKWFEHYDGGQTALNPGVVLSQNLSFGNWALTESFSYAVNLANNPFYNRTDYRLSSALNLPEVFWR